MLPAILPPLRRVSLHFAKKPRLRWSLIFLRNLFVTNGLDLILIWQRKTGIIDAAKR